MHLMMAIASKQALGTDTGDYNFVLTSLEDATFVSYGEFSEILIMNIDGVMAKWSKIGGRQGLRCRAWKY